MSIEIHPDFARYIENRVRKENTLRLFQQLHQNDDFIHRRASGSTLCVCCKLPYRDHPDDIEHLYAHDSYDKRLCSGDVVHL